MKLSANEEGGGLSGLNLDAGEWVTVCKKSVCNPF